MQLSKFTRSVLAFMLNIPTFGRTYLAVDSWAPSALEAVRAAPELHFLNICKCDGEQALMGIGAGHGRAHAPHTLDHPAPIVSSLSLIVSTVAAAGFVPARLWRSRHCRAGRAAI